MQVTQPITEARPLAWTTPDGRFTIVVARTVEAYAVRVENAAGFRIDELARTFATESDARDLARLIAKRLRDGATVDEVVAAIQPAADVISAATALLELAAAVRKLSQPQRDAIRAADSAGHIDRKQVGTVKTLYALDNANLGDLLYEDPRRPYRPTGLDLNGRGRQMQAHILTHRTTVAA